MLRAFERMGQGVLYHLGENSLLVRGTEQLPCRVNVEHDVAMAGPYDDAMLTRDVVSLPGRFLAKVGDEVIHPDGRYRLDGVLANNGVIHRFVGMKLAL